MPSWLLIFSTKAKLPRHWFSRAGFICNLLPLNQYLALVRPHELPSYELHFKKLRSKRLSLGFPLRGNVKNKDLILCF